MGLTSYLRSSSTLALVCLLVAHVAFGLAPQPAEFSPGLTPLTDLGGNTYLGSRGGLYPDGSNRRPTEHEAAGPVRGGGG